MAMALTGGPAVVKYLLFIFNLIFVITGIVVLSVGGVIKSAYGTYNTFLDDRFLAVPSLLIAVGVIIIVVSFFGCCGSVKENHCMIITFSVLLLFIFVLELSAGIAGYALRDRAKTFLTDELDHRMLQYNSSQPLAEAWDEMQENLKCCGVTEPSDWAKAFPTNETIINLPMSCCAKASGMVGEQLCNTNTSNLFKTGCLEKLGGFVVDHAATVGGVGIGIAFIEVLGVGFACCLARSIRRQYESV